MLARGHDWLPHGRFSLVSVANRETVVPEALLGFPSSGQAAVPDPSRAPRPPGSAQLGGRLIGHVPLPGLLPCRLGFPLQTLPQAGLTGARSGTTLSCPRSRPQRWRAGGRGGVWAPFIQVPAEQIGPCPTSAPVQGLRMQETAPRQALRT